MFTRTLLGRAESSTPPQSELKRSISSANDAASFEDRDMISCSRFPVRHTRLTSTLLVGTRREHNARCDPCHRSPMTLQYPHTTRRATTPRTKTRLALSDKKGTSGVQREVFGDLLRALGQNPTQAEVVGVIQQAPREGELLLL